MPSARGPWLMRASITGRYPAVPPSRGCVKRRPVQQEGRPDPGCARSGDPAHSPTRGRITSIAVRCRSPCDVGPVTATVACCRRRGHGGFYTCTEQRSRRDGRAGQGNRFRCEGATSAIPNHHLTTQSSMGQPAYLTTRLPPPARNQTSWYSSSQKQNLEEFGISRRLRLTKKIISHTYVPQ
jgi:hypothetical protein